MTAQSPRRQPSKLRSTVKEQYGTPRTESSTFQRIALARGYTIKAGAARRERLQPGIVSVRYVTPKNGE